MGPSGPLRRGRWSSEVCGELVHNVLGLHERVSRVRVVTRVEQERSRDELVERYASATGADLSELPYYRSFNSWKTACILHGVYARYRAGQKSTEGVDLDGLFARIGLSVDAAATMAEQFA